MIAVGKRELAHKRPHHDNIAGTDGAAIDSSNAIVAISPENAARVTTRPVAAKACLGRVDAAAPGRHESAENRSTRRDSAMRRFVATSPKSRRVEIDAP